MSHIRAAAESSLYTSSQDLSITPSARAYSCLRCAQRKVKCDRTDPCANCKKSHVDCVFVVPAPSRRKKRKLPEEDLVTRLKLYEELLKNNGVEFDAYDLPEQTRSSAPDTIYAVGGHIKKEASQGLQTGELISEHGESRYVDNHLWRGLQDEFRGAKDLLYSSSDEERLRSSNLNTSGSNNSYEAALLFESPPAKMTLIDLHPQPVLIFRLWQTFLDNVNPLTKIIHAPTLQQSILDATGNLEHVSKGLETLMFAIYNFAVTSSSNAYCENMLGEAKTTLLARYRRGTQQALIRAEFLKSSELTVLQAFVLYLLSVCEFYDHRSLWAYTGVAVRIGQRLGLHRDGTSLGLPIFETELRRRLWWQIVILDARTAELCGSGKSVLANLWDTKYVLNVNDSDLSPNMREPPMEHDGMTEMAFCMVRSEIGKFMQHSDSSGTFDNELKNPSIIVESLARKDRAIDKLRDVLELRFVRFCDPMVPLHIHVAGVAKAAVCRLRLVAHHPRQYADPKSIPQTEKDLLFHNSLEIIEQDNLGHSNKLTQQFLWHVTVFFQLEALIYLLNELRHRTAGKLIDKAWQQVDEAFGHHPELLTGTKNPLFSAIQNLAIKAWEARKEELSRQNRGLGGMILKTSSLISTLALKKTPYVATQAVASNARSGPPGPVSQQPSNYRLVDNGISSSMGQLGDTSNGFGLSTFSDSLETDLNVTDWAYWDDLLKGSDPLAVNGSDW